MFANILVVCTGNVCRSPMAEVVLKDRLGEEFLISSAGTGALKGQDMEPLAIKLLTENELEPGKHVARQVNTEMLSKADLILVMDSKNKSMLAGKYPAMMGKIQFFGKWESDKEVPDPYRQQKPAFEHVYKLIEQFAEQWTQKLKDK